MPMRAKIECEESRNTKKDLNNATRRKYYKWMKYRQDMTDGLSSLAQPCGRDDELTNKRIIP